MQKVEGSSPFSRLNDSPAHGGVSFGWCRALGHFGPALSLGATKAPGRLLALPSVDRPSAPEDPRRVLVDLVEEDGDVGCRVGVGVAIPFAVAGRATAGSSSCLARRSAAARLRCSHSGPRSGRHGARRSTMVSVFPSSSASTRTSSCASGGTLCSRSSDGNEEGPCWNAVGPARRRPVALSH
jgi:hypothetical protein